MMDSKQPIKPPRQPTRPETPDPMPAIPLMRSSLTLPTTTRPSFRVTYRELALTSTHGGKVRHQHQEDEHIAHG
jgi:hypothetical protein